MTTTNATGNLTNDSMADNVFHTQSSVLESLSFIKSLSKDEMDRLSSGLAYFLNNAPIEEIKKLAAGVREIALSGN